VQRSGRDDALATSLGLRPEIPRHHFLRLLSIASEEVRAKLEGANPQAAREIRRVVREITVRMQAKSIAGSFEYSKALQRVEALSAQGPLNERNLMALAAAGKFEDTVVALSQLARVSIALAERAILQERTELLLSLLKSIALSWPAVKTILQLRSQSRMMTATDVDRCLASYERLKAQTADMVVKFHSKKGGVA
jgi:hypothetical protein